MLLNGNPGGFVFFLDGLPEWSLTEDFGFWIKSNMIFA